MWSVEFESTAVEKEVQMMLSKKILTENDRRIISTWIRQITFYGPDSIAGNKKWADHELLDNWQGYRSSAFSNQGRIIYRVEEKVIKIFIARITTEHNYRK